MASSKWALMVQRLRGGASSGGRDMDDHDFSQHSPANARNTKAAQCAALSMVGPVGLEPTTKGL